MEATAQVAGEQRPAQSKKNRVILAVASTLLLLTGYVGYRLYDANSHYDQAIQDLDAKQWQQAKEKFELAKQQGLFLYQDGPELYRDWVNQIGNQEVKEAYSALNAVDLDAYHLHLGLIPFDYDQNKVEELRKRDPSVVKVTELIPSGLTVDSQRVAIPIKDTPAIIVEAYEGEQLNKQAHFYYLHYDPSIGKYINGFTLTSPGVNSMKTSIGKLTSTEQDSIVIEMISMGGSGYGESITVLGQDEQTGKLVRYLELPSIYMGTSEIKDGRLIVHSPSKDMEYVWNGTEFEGRRIEIRQPVQVGDLTVYYSISATGEMNISSDIITLNVGQKFVLQRDDDNEISKRILFGVDGPIKAEGENTFTAVQSGETEIQIIPNSYDWEKAKTLKVKVN